MLCPDCGHPVSAVKFTKNVGTHTMRWHVCKKCFRDFETHEVHVLPSQPHSVQSYNPLAGAAVEDDSLATLINSNEEE